MIFPLKGSRDYVHGTSIFDELVRSLPSLGLEESQVDLAFHRMIYDSICRVEIRDAIPGDSVVAKFTTIQGDQVVVCLNGAESDNVAERVPYDEETLARQASIQNGSICSAVVDGYSDVEHMVALCKRLHLEHYQGEAKRWVFSRYRGIIPLHLDGDVRITIVKSIGARLTCSEVFTAGRKLGEIYFSCIS